jgi:hypothetical protein
VVSQKQQCNKEAVMPGLNKKGPDGAGAMTGRQRGMCRRTENQSLGGDGSGRGRGMGMRRGSGQGRNLQQGPGGDQAAGTTQSTQNAGSEELTDLKEQYQAAQQALDMLEKKIAALESGK